MAQRNTTNGSCFDPQQARAEREARGAAERRHAFEAEKHRIIQAERDKAAAKKQHTSEMRAYGRMMDQIERCYRQHTPAQIEHAEEMKACGHNVAIICPLDLTTMIREGSL